MPPRYFPGFADFPQHSRESGISLEAFGFVDFTGIDIGLASVTCGIDEEGKVVGCQVIR